MEIPKKTMDRWSILRRTSYIFARLIVPRFMRILFRLRVHHSEYVSMFPEGTPVIYCINHRSHLDAIVLASAVAVPYGPRTQLALMASGNAMRNNWFFGLTRFLGAFPVYKEKPEEAFDYAAKSMKKGIGVLIAPQGKRVLSTPYHDYFNLEKEGKTGVGRLILRFNGKVPVVPAYIHGSAEALSRGKILPRFRASLSISFGSPMYWHEYTRSGGWKNGDPDFYPTAREITDKIMVQIQKQLIIREKDFFVLLERKCGATIDNIVIHPNKKKEFDKMVFKLLQLHPEQLQKLVQSGAETC
ncbi:MAG: lysophospholipid acyltransferase family protein [Candidatus Hodarchaeales archaeon]